MRSIIMLTINGEKFFFEDPGFAVEEKKGIQDLAKNISQGCPTQNIQTENDICKYFVNEVKSCLGISLVHVYVSFVTRINCKASG